MWFSGNQEDIEIAESWLQKLTSKEEAKANLLVLSFYKKNLEDEKNEEDHDLGEDTYWRMIFETYKTQFGKDYRYKILLKCAFFGELIVDQINDYSRYQVGNDFPYHDLCQLICDKIRSKGITIHKGLFVEESKIAEETIKTE